jgi:predicted nucleic acid-binding Zn ribbon protein
MPEIPGDVSRGTDAEGSDGPTELTGRADLADTESSRFYLRLKGVFTDSGSRPRLTRKRYKAKEDGGSQPFGPGRDPKGLGSALDALTAQLGWQSPLAQSSLMESWAEIAGAETAKHSTPAGIEDGRLTVQCESTAWATQLRLMRVAIMTSIAQRYPDAGITSVRFLGPDAPSWKKGPRSIPGRGPRDTYG